MLHIVGGTYIENCREPEYHNVFGSGLRALTALSNSNLDLYFHTCCGDDYSDSVVSVCETYNASLKIEKVDRTFSWNYKHPLAAPILYPEVAETLVLHPIVEDNILYYGMIEALVKVTGKYVVYDPQNWVSFKKTGSTAEHLAIILNKKEALLQYNGSSSNLHDVGKSILEDEGAEVIVIKNGSSGALVIDKNGYYEIPVFETKSVWPIGSGDVFSAVFAWKWIYEKLKSSDAARLASIYTAQYCETGLLPFTEVKTDRNSLILQSTPRYIYLAGPFFSPGERWLINELRNALKDFGNEVFSPLHDVGFGASSEVANRDLEALKKADVILAVTIGMDPGTLFEIGFAKALDKKVVIFHENEAPKNLVMLLGTDCLVAANLSTAVYMASW